MSGVRRNGAKTVGSGEKRTKKYRELGPPPPIGVSILNRSVQWKRFALGEPRSDAV